MNFSLIDATGLLVSALSYVPLLLLPGVAMVWAGGWRDSRRDGDSPLLLAAVVAGLATLPVIDSLCVRTFGLSATLVLNLALAVLGAFLAVRSGWRPRFAAADVVILTLWFLLLMVEWIDFDFGGRLYHPYLVLDMVKHAATTQAIHDSGAPSLDPFFFRPGRVSYYYFFYTLSALSEQMCSGLADARAAVGGLVFWTGIGLYGAIRFAILRTGLIANAWSRRVGFTCLAVIAIGGLDVIPVLKLGLQDVWLPDPATWNVQVTSAMESLIWVPHHVTALIASVVGFMALTDPAPERALRRAVFAGACFASALGLSVWVTLAAVTTAGCWLISLIIARRWIPMTGLLIAGGVALVLGGAQIWDLHAGRGASGLPIAFTVRAFSPVEILMPPGLPTLLARFVCLPVNYFAEFGILASGALLLWQDRRRFPTQQTEFRRVMIIGAVCGLALGSFLESTLYNNDLGWRVVLLPLFAGIVCTVAALEGRFASSPAPNFTSLMRQIPALLWILGVIGFGTTLYALINNRTYAGLTMPRVLRFTAAEPIAQHDLRGAYVWANTHLPPTFVLQHNPAPPRVFPFGLYSRNRVAIADGQAGLYGATDAAVMARGAALAPIFTQSLPAKAVRGRAQANGVDALVIDSDDPVWRTPSSWVWTSKPLYSAGRVRIIATTAVGSPP